MIAHAAETRADNESDDPRLAELLLRWEEHHERGLDLDDEMSEGSRE